ncbi:hypothetical protein Q5O24_05370 [Eubacteriaceae bacterium ES3]|nr:hypothetical protein Q5O24_05370 [Eubacteriaceae bacterium ES3]
METNTYEIFEKLLKINNSTNLEDELLLKIFQSEDEDDLFGFVLSLLI